MQNLLRSLMSMVRVCLGWNQPSTDRPDGLPLTPAHGWLLPLSASEVREARAKMLPGQPRRS